MECDRICGEVKEGLVRVKERISRKLREAPVLGPLKEHFEP